MTEPRRSEDLSGWLSKWSDCSQKYENVWFKLTGRELVCYKDGPAQISCEKLSLAGGSVDYDETCKFIICHEGEALHVKANDQREKQRWVDALNAALQSAPTKGLEPQEHGQSGSATLSIPSKPYSLKDSDNNITDGNVNATASGSETSRNNQIRSNCSANDNKPPTTAIELNIKNPNDSDAATADIVAEITCADNPTFPQQGEALISTMKNKLKDINIHNGIVNTRYSTLQRTIMTMENIQNPESHIFQEVSIKAAEFQTNASELIQACRDYMKFAESHCWKWIAVFESEIERREKLEDIIDTLIQTPLKSSEEGESKEYDDCTEPATSSDMSFIDVALQVYQAVGGQPGGQERRTRIPNRPNVSDSLWSVFKHCLGSDLSKMPLPVSFSEPLSLLQRLTEDFEYAHVLDTASDCADTATQFAYVAAFISSSYSTTIGRSGKPFNPLLGETYECDRQRDCGWRSIAEQVSHHPPVAAIYCEGKSWEFWMDQSMKTKFKGTTLTVFPLGECHLNFRNGNRYSWRKPTTCIHNIIVGKLWVEQEGDVDIKCATSDISCKLSFVSSGWSGEPYTVKGVIKESNGKTILDLVGKYSTQINYRRAGSKDPGTVIWKRTAPAEDHAKYYYFTQLACQLNEMENGVAPTDSRHRPDQRLMEEGDFDAANAMKKKLEEHQRANKKDTWKPSWFKHQADPDTKTEIWTYGGEYWPCKAKKDWSRCPSHIFSPP